MTQVSAHLHRGAADPPGGACRARPTISSAASWSDLIDQVPGVEERQLVAKAAALPLIVEGMAVAVLGFLFGLLLAYLVELRRRYNAQWNW